MMFSPDPKNCCTCSMLSYAALDGTFIAPLMCPAAYSSAFRASMNLASLALKCATTSSSVTNWVGSSAGVGETLTGSTGLLVVPPSGTPGGGVEGCDSGNFGLTVSAGGTHGTFPFVRSAFVAAPTP